MRTDLEIINEALDGLDTALAFTWREIRGHAHDGSGPATDGRSIRDLARQQGHSHPVVLNRYRAADRAVCSAFANYYRSYFNVGGIIGDHALAPINRYTARRNRA